MTPVSALRARHRLQYRVIDAGELANIDVWKANQWNPFRYGLDHATADYYIKVLEAGENEVKDERKK